MDKNKTTIQRCSEQNKTKQLYKGALKGEERKADQLENWGPKS